MAPDCTRIATHLVCRTHRRSTHLDDTVSRVYCEKHADGWRERMKQFPSYTGYCARILYHIP